MSVIYPMGKYLGRFCFGTFGRLEVKGHESVPPFGPLLLVCNHISYIDPPLLVVTIGRRLNFIGKQDLFFNPLSRFILKQFNVYPLNRSGPAVDTVRLSLDLLSQDQALVVFPEGRRSSDHSLQQGLPGAAYIALKSQAILLPVGITGAEKVPLWRIPFPFVRLSVNIGQPFSLPVIEGTPSREVMKSLSDMIMGRIAALLPEKYRGIYGPAVAGAPEGVSSSLSPATGPDMPQEPDD